MEWLSLAGTVLFGFFLGMSVRGRAPQNAQSPLLTRLGMNMASDRELMLATFRRELANYMVRLDPDRFLHLYRNARAAEKAIEVADKEEREAQLTILTKKYDLYSDFDLVGTREHVLYADAFNMYPLEDIEEHYLNLMKFHALQRTLNPDWQFRNAATSDEDLDHLKKYVPKIKDTRFRQRLMAAVNQFFAHKQGNWLDHPEGATAYETNVFAVYYVSHFAENRYGFHFKDTDEFGLYSSFYDDSRDKSYQSFYRSDRKFEAENYLDHLLIDEPI